MKIASFKTMRFVASKQIQIRLHNVISILGTQPRQEMRGGSKRQRTELIFTLVHITIPVQGIHKRR